VQISVEQTLGLNELLEMLPKKSGAVALLTGLLLRAIYGGMKCDISMMEKYTALWFDRFTNSQVIHVSSRQNQSKHK
jgi:hypothetical protein